MKKDQSRTPSPRPIERICMFCEHLRGSIDHEDGYYAGDHAYTEAEISCGKKHWHFRWGDYPEKGHLKLLADLIHEAKTCIDYKQVTI